MGTMIQVCSKGNRESMAKQIRQRTWSTASSEREWSWERHSSLWWGGLPKTLHAKHSVVKAGLFWRSKKKCIVFEKWVERKEKERKKERTKKLFWMKCETQNEFANDETNGNHNERKERRKGKEVSRRGKTKKTFLGFFLCQLSFQIFIFCFMFNIIY